MNGWNEKDETDQSHFCLWCNQPLTATKCTITNWYTGENEENGPGLIRFSHEGCGMFKFIVIKGPLKGTIWSNDPNGDDPLSQDKGTFKELLDDIYSEENKKTFCGKGVSWKIVPGK